MRQLVNNMLLYHGSYCAVQEPDLRQCARYKDFGRGFYVTTSRVQAENFAKISTRRAAANRIIASKNQGSIVSVFRLRLAEDISVKIYPDADAEWLRCIVGHRKIKTFPKVVDELRSIDIIGGKIANDNTNATITTYMAGGFGEIGTDSAEDICIRLLLPERLEDQFCFRTNAAIKCLAFEESVQIWQ